MTARSSSVCMLRLSLMAMLLTWSPTCWASPWQENIRAIKSVPYESSKVLRFRGNTSSDDHFRKILADGEYVLIEARNAVYNLTMPDMLENKKIEWFAEDDDVMRCKLKGRSEEDCHNYIRVLARKSPGRFLVCGTYAYRTRCRHYAYKDGEYMVEKQVNGQGVSPYSPSHNSTAVLVDDELFVGTVADFAGVDALIYREPFRTLQYDATLLNDPNFVSSFAHDNYVYFTFRETAVEYMNSDKTVYSRIARVCKSDRGGPHKFRYRWTSFLKSRLVCSIKVGDSPFYFNEIQSTAGPYRIQHEGKQVDIIYATFTTPSNAISGSAVCAFRFDDIEKTFDGAFKEKLTLNSNWLPVPEDKVPLPRPGKCVNDSQTLPDVTLNFIATHSLMDESVPSILNEPLITHAGFYGRFTKIEVDPQVKTPDGKYYDVLFIGTDNGKVIKAVRTDSEPVIIEEIQVFQLSVPVIDIVIHRGKDVADGLQKSRLVVSSQSDIASLKLQRCVDKISSCSECVKLRDPYCAWDDQKQKCVATGSSSMGANLFQSVATGVHESCPESTLKSDSSSSSTSSKGKKPSTNYNRVPEIVDGNKDDVSMKTGSILNLDLDTEDFKSPESEGSRISPAESQPKYTVETLQCSKSGNENRQCCQIKLVLKIC